jgi:hypothetical protein
MLLQRQINQTLSRHALWRNVGSLAAGKSGEIAESERLSSSVANCNVCTYVRVYVHTYVVRVVTAVARIPESNSKISL